LEKRIVGKCRAEKTTGRERVNEEDGLGEAVGEEMSPFSPFSLSQKSL
jgi:hypothetical protein